MRLFTIRAVYLIVLIFAGLSCESYARTSPPCDDGSINDASGFRIRSVKVDARFLSIPLPSKGAPYTRSEESQLVVSVRNALNLEKNRESIEGATLGQITGKFPTSISLQTVTTCVQVIEPAKCLEQVGHSKCVDITVLAKSLRFSPDDLATNILGAVPRAGSPTLTSNVPKPLLVFNPQFGVEHDRSIGLSQTLKVSTNLLDVPDLLENKIAKVRPWRLDLKAFAYKSLNKPFYDSDVDLTLTKFLPNSFFESVSVRTTFGSKRIPLAKADLFQNAFSVGGDLHLKPNTRFVKSIILEGSFSRRNNRFIGEADTGPLRTVERSATGRVLVNAQIRNDVLRFSFWADHSKPDTQNSAYTRLTGLLGYAKDFGSGNQTFGLELLAGAGRVKGVTPAYGSFYPDNNLKNFIFADDKALELRDAPGGPLLRSFGSGDRTRSGAPNAFAGGRSYWNVSANLSVPIAKWSRQLIPDDKIELDSANPSCPITTIRDLIRCQAGSGEVILSAIYKRQGVVDHAEKAKKEFKNIRSAIDFLTNHANLYAFKPLVMFDIAHLRGGAADGLVRSAVGGGFQLTVVTAKFEGGYMWTINRRPGDSSGNFTMRLYFQNFF